MADKRVCWHHVLATLAVVGLLAAPHGGWAHPLGNFSISHYTAIRLEPDALVLRYLIDMAEIPTFQEIQDAQIVPQQGHPSLPAYLARRVEALCAGLILELDGTRLPLRPEASEIMFPPGAGGLPTLKLGMRCRATIEAASAPTAHELRYRDTNFPGRAGWKEIIATTGHGMMLLSSNVSEHDRSQELTDYPTDLLHSPPQDVEARVIFAGGGSPASAQVRAQSPPIRLAANQQATPRSAFTELVATPQLGLGIVLVAMAAAIGLGAFHALEPGHGKTVVAAYLVGSRGTAWHALLLGLTVTITHTAGVYLLGAVTLFASRYVVPERLYPWLAVTSGLLIAGLGFTLFLRRYTAAGHVQAHGQAQQHAPGHTHPHGLHSHPHHSQPRHVPATVSRRELLALGVTGGIVPCPAALVVLLSALSFHRVGFGLLLILAFSIGLAAVLIAIGIAMVYAHRLMARFQEDGVLMTRWLPLTSATVMTIVGVAIALQALV
jgi:ABC-type nickel/cobalt efflux system permease component RcnA